jgi:hypothetical protein
MSFTNYSVPLNKPNYSNYSTLGVQAARGCTDPCRETQLYELNTLDELYKINYLPRLRKNWQVAPRYSAFPLECSVTNKASNIHLGYDETYYNLKESPLACFAKSCDETNIPVHITNKLKN